MDNLDEWGREKEYKRGGHGRMETAHLKRVASSEPCWQCETRAGVNCRHRTFDVANPA